MDSTPPSADLDRVREFSQRADAAAADRDRAAYDFWFVLAEQLGMRLASEHGEFSIEEGPDYWRGVGRFTDSLDVACIAAAQTLTRRGRVPRYRTPHKATRSGRTIRRASCSRRSSSSSGRGDPDSDSDEPARGRHHDLHIDASWRRSYAAWSLHAPAPPQIFYPRTRGATMSPHERRTAGAPNADRSELSPPKQKSAEHPTSFSPGNPVDVDSTADTVGCRYIFGHRRVSDVPNPELVHGFIAAMRQGLSNAAGGVR